MNGCFTLQPRHPRRPRPLVVGVYPHTVLSSDLVARHPVLYHLASAEAWPSICRHGLLSTVDLLDAFQVADPLREQALGSVRRDSLVLSHPVYGTAVVRDQRPLKFIDRCLTPGTTLEDFLDALNARVFFWASRERVDRLLGARAYRAGRHVLLQVPTERMLERYGGRVELAPYNTGSTHVPTAPSRGPEVFVPVAQYPYDTRGIVPAAARTGSSR